MNDCIISCKRLIDLLEEDASEFGRAAEEDMLDAYRDILMKEIDEMNDVMHALQLMW